MRPLPQSAEWNATSAMLLLPKVHFARKQETANNHKTLWAHSWYIIQKGALTLKVSALIFSIAMALSGTGVAQEPIGLLEDLDCRFWAREPLAQKPK